VSFAVDWADSVAVIGFFGLVWFYKIGIMVS
jgi:hypothetical protein